MVSQIVFLSPQEKEKNCQKNNRIFFENIKKLRIVKMYKYLI